MSRKSDAEGVMFAPAATMVKISDQVCDHMCWTVAAEFITRTMDTLEIAAQAGLYEATVPNSGLYQAIALQWPNLGPDSAFWEDIEAMLVRCITHLMGRKGYVVLKNDSKILISWCPRETGQT